MPAKRQFGVSLGQGDAGVCGGWGVGWARGEGHISGQGQHVQSLPLKFVLFAFCSFIFGLLREICGSQS
jgi:hypothetical protein